MEARRKLKMALFRAVLGLFLIVVAGCGGGGNGSAVVEGGGSTPGVSGTVSGTAVKGPVANGTVTAFSINPNGTMGGQIGTGMTDAQGRFSVQVGDYSGPMMLRMTGGSYMDEATGISMNMGQNDSLTSVIPFMTAGSMMSGIQMTPLTSMAQNMAQFMAGGMTTTNIMSANNAIAQYFSVNDILSTPPMNPLLQNAGQGADQNMKNYGMTIAAMSQYADTMGMADSSNMVSAMMNDVADGHMDGMMGSTGIEMGGGMMGGTTPGGGMNGGTPGGGMMDGTTPGGGMMGVSKAAGAVTGGGGLLPADAGTTGLAAAMMKFIQSPMNKSGVTVQDMGALIDKLNASNGTIR
ncbi:MAG: hypothetical protein M1497_03510 [Nitrospirae bacterium]|nr:hypothetical protein [Nitrospirota bacterium]